MSFLGWLIRYCRRTQDDYREVCADLRRAAADVRRAWSA